MDVGNKINVPVVDKPEEKKENTIISEPSKKIEKIIVEKKNTEKPNKFPSLFKIIMWILFFVFIALSIYFIMKYKKLNTCDNENIYEANTKLENIKIEFSQNSREFANTGKNFELFIRFKDLSNNLISSHVNTI